MIYYLFEYFHPYPKPEMKDRGPPGVPAVDAAGLQPNLCLEFSGARAQDFHGGFRNESGM